MSLSIAQELPIRNEAGLLTDGRTRTDVRRALPQRRLLKHALNGIVSLLVPNTVMAVVPDSDRLPCWSALRLRPRRNPAPIDEIIVFIIAQTAAKVNLSDGDGLGLHPMETALAAGDRFTRTHGAGILAVAENRNRGCIDPGGRENMRAEGTIPGMQGSVGGTGRTRPARSG